MLKKILTTAGVAALLLLAAPAAANAVSYPSGAPCSTDLSVVQMGDTATVTCAPGTWAPSELVTWTASGFDGTDIHLASSVTFSEHANADGSEILHVTLPSDASGVYTVTGVGATSGHVCSASLTVLPANNPAVNTGSSSNSGLAATGSVIAEWSLWLGGGLLVIGIVSVALAAWLRKVRSS